MKITDLNVDCLVRICGYLNERDLLNMCRANLFLEQIIEENIFFLQSLDLLMCGHRNGPSIQKRTQSPLSYHNRLCIARNWLEGRYREYDYFHHGQLFFTKLHLESDWLYITHTSYLRQYQRLRAEPLQRRYQREISSKVKTDIVSFVKKRDALFVGHVCGSCFLYEGDDLTSEQHLHTPKEYLYCVDFADDLYVSSSNKCCKLWRRSEEFGLVHLDLVKQLNHAYKTVRFSDSGSRLYGGLYTDVNRRALREIDVNSGIEMVLDSKSISIYDLKLMDENVVFTANFDTTFRMYDRRSNKDETVWEDPFDSSFYCLDYDGLYAVLCGTKYYSRVNLYDIRVPGKYMQLYFPHRSRHHRNSSPVYSLACDSRYLFVATAHSLCVLDYKTDCAVSKDYRNIFSEIRRF